MNSQPSPELSKQVVNAIQQALRDEKVPFGRRLLKVFLASVGCAVILATPLLLAFREQVNSAWSVAILAWWFCLFVGFYLYYYPQPKLAVPGFWSPWIFARVLLAMVLLTAVEILICPSFVFLVSPLPWNPFGHLSHLFMAYGGMKMCMFSCGFIFSSLGGLVTFGLISKTLKGSSLEDIFKATGVAYFTQLPIVGIQIMEPELRPFVVFWMMGGLLGTFLMATLIRAIAPVLRQRTSGT